MGIQQEIFSDCELLDNQGHITRAGYARRPFWQYNRKKIQAPWYRIKEWDYYAVLAPDRGFGITFTLADLGYAGIAAVCWLDFKQRQYRQVESTRPFPMGRMGLPRDSEAGTTRFHSKQLTLSFAASKGCRTICFDAPAFCHQGSTGLKGELRLVQPPDMESMVIATPWKENPRAFYYNRKINCMPAQGQVTLGSRAHDFTADTDFGTLDWGRGNWTYKNRWYWGSASGRLDRAPLGWNIGCGFSDRSAASENMLFYRGKAHKLDEVFFHFDSDDYMKPWTFHSSDNRFEMDFFPILDRQSAFDFKLIKSIQHQVFGHFSGRIRLDDGTCLEVRDFFGFAEEVFNCW